MELPKRKPNRLQNYDYSSNGGYFVTICTEGREKTLSEIVGDGFPVPKRPGEIAEQMILQIPKRYAGVTVEQYVVMPNHIHMLIRIDSMMDGRDGEPVPYEGKWAGRGTRPLLR